MMLATGCRRPPTITETFFVPEMKTEKDAENIQASLNNQLPTEITAVTANLNDQTLTVTFKEQFCRKMNVEESIAEAGYAVNARPAQKK